MILVTGAAGFIGSHVVEQLLQKGLEVHGIDNFDSFYDKEIKIRNILPALTNKKYSFHEGDICDSNFLNSLPAIPSVVIHLAAKAGVQPSLRDPQGYVNTNINGTVCILEWMKKNGVNKLVFASSSSVYGNNTVPFSEEDSNIYPLSPYAQTKRSCELLNFTYHHLYQFDVINLRFFTVFGPRQRPDLAIHKFVKLISRGEPINFYGAGDTRRDYTFINDITQGVINACDYLVQHKRIYEIINLGNNASVSLSELVHTIEKVVGKKAILNQLPEQPGDMKITCASIEKAQRILNYMPETTLEKGVQIFYKWFQQNEEDEQAKYSYTYL